MGYEHNDMPHQPVIVESINEILAPLIQNKKAFYLVDSSVYELWKDKINTNGSEVIIVPAGDDSKGIQQCETIWNILLEHKADRDSILVNIGGGMVCDLGGFCAAVYKRGISFINVPTTLLSMVDAAIGGKTAINFHHRKNMLGATSQPDKVLIYTGFLQTLPKEEFSSGLAEIIKHSIVSGTKMFENICYGFPELEKKKNWEELILANIKLKLDVTEKDPFDQNIRQMLNLGHTAGHAIEAFGNEKKLRILHGQAVAAGLIIEAEISYQLGFLNSEEQNKIVQLVDTYFKRLSFKTEDIASIVGYAYDDKKNKEGNLMFSLPFSIGDVRYGVACSEDLFKSALQEYLK